MKGRGTLILYLEVIKYNVAYQGSVNNHED